MAYVFEFTNYKEFLRASLPIQGPSRGGRTRLADFLNCKLGFISQVLSGSADFSFEHGILISEFLHLNSEEEEFFLLLMQKDRAGSVKLQIFFQNKITLILNQRKEIQSRIQKTKELTEEQKNTYYSRWTYNGIHMCTLIPHLRNPTQMSEYLGIPLVEVTEILSDLEKFSLVQRKGSEFHPTSKRLHLGEKSLSLRSHHINWRMEAIRSLDRKSPEKLNYSSVMSISHSAAEKIQSLLLKLIENSEPIISEAKDEAVFVLTLDLFELGHKK